ncbi:MAG TPA: hypothetical protein VJ201_04605, partial [Candidatus Babeliales bacterium]|nr:hypothetical protein [Candidatus Babeliales bacterium]
MQQKKRIIKKYLIFIIGTLFLALPSIAQGMTKPVEVTQAGKLEEALTVLKLAMDRQAESSFNYDNINTNLLVEKYQTALHSIAGKILVALGQNVEDGQLFPFLPPILSTDLNKTRKEENRKSHAYKLIENLIGDLQEHFIVLELSVLLIKNIPFDASLYYTLTILDVVFVKFNELITQDGFGPIRHLGLLTKLINKFTFLHARLVRIPKAKHKQTIEERQKKLNQQISILDIKYFESVRDSIKEIKGYENCLNKFELPPTQVYFSPGIIPVLCKLVNDEQEGVTAAYYRFTHHDLAQAFMNKSNALKQHGGGGNPTPIQLIVDKDFQKDNCRALMILLHNKIPVLCNGKTNRFGDRTVKYENMHHKFMILHRNKDDRPLLVTGSFNPTGQA